MMVAKKSAKKFDKKAKRVKKEKKSRPKYDIDSCMEIGAAIDSFASPIKQYEM